MQGELDRVSQALTGRIRQLAERYATPLPRLAVEVETLASRVDKTPEEYGVRMDVRPNYKQTQVGVIPEQWEVRRLDEVVDFFDGRRRPVKDSDRAKMRGDIPYYGASGIVDYVNDYIFDDELILLGEDGENILSRNCRLAFRVSGKVWVNNHAHVLKPKDGNDIGYLTEFLESLDYGQYNTGTAQPKLNKRVCSAIPVATPTPPAEQRAIAAALSDMDALLAKLDQLIVKKRDLKQAAMQQLLTGQTRLPGFSGEWEVAEAGDIGTVSRRKRVPHEVSRSYVWRLSVLQSLRHEQ